MLVDGSANAEPRIDNAATPTDFDTEISVRITLNGQDVTTGVVTITSANDVVELVFDPQADNGRWRGIAAGYDQVYVLDVTAGADTIEGVRVDGPSIHTFVTPTMGETVDSTLPLDLEWSRATAADIARVDVAEIDTLSVTDSGTFTLPARALKADGEQPRENTLRLTRANTIAPAGAVAGSTWAVTIRNQIQVITQADPTL